MLPDDIVMLENNSSLNIFKLDSLLGLAIISFTLTFPWVVITSLVEHYSDIYGKEYCVYLFFTYHCIALPVLYVEEQIDFFVVSLYGHVDSRLHSIYGLVILTLALVGAPFAGEFGLILLSGLIGGCTWLFGKRTATFAGQSLVGIRECISLLGHLAPIAFCTVYAVITYSETNHYSSFSVRMFYFSAATLHMAVILMLVRVSLFYRFLCNPVVSCSAAAMLWEASPYFPDIARSMKLTIH